MFQSTRVKYGVITGIVALVIVLPVLLVVNYYTTPGKYDDFAQCLKDKGAMFYGAFWCPHCQTQKLTFGKSAKKLPYTECSTPDGRGQLQVCKDNGVTGYPTWKFADGTELSGEQSFETLAEKTQCEL
jgi:hypothetical protein